MGDSLDPEEILAELDEPSWLETISSFLHSVASNLVSKGWALPVLFAFVYLMFKSYVGNRNGKERDRSEVTMSDKELDVWKCKEEARLKAVDKLQRKYQEDSAAKEEKLKKIEAEKREKRIAELDNLIGGKRLGREGDESKSLKQEYNPLMGSSSSGRVCFRRPGGGASG